MYWVASHWVGIRALGSHVVSHKTSGIQTVQLALHPGPGQNQDSDPDYPSMMNLQQIHAKYSRSRYKKHIEACKKICKSSFLHMCCFFVCTFFAHICNMGFPGKTETDMWRKTTHPKDMGTCTKNGWYVFCFLCLLCICWVSIQTLTCAGLGLQPRERILKPFYTGLNDDGNNNDHHNDDRQWL